MTAPAWNLQPGETLIREQIHGQYGGNPQAGISRSSSTPNVLVCSDHDKAAANGYDFDGWDAAKQVFYYTGEGKVGNQLMQRGNKAIADHAADGNALRLFVAIGNRQGPGTRIHRYAGQFAVDPALPYVQRMAPGTDGIARSVFVFRLIPTGPVVTDQAPTSSIEGANEVAEIAALATDEVPLAAMNRERTEVQWSVSTAVTQKEAQLTGRFQIYLEEHHRKVKRYRIIPAGSEALYSDLGAWVDIANGIGREGVDGGRARFAGDGEFWQR